MCVYVCVCARVPNLSVSKRVCVRACVRTCVCAWLARVCQNVDEIRLKTLLLVQSLCCFLLPYNRRFRRRILTLGLPHAPKQMFPSALELIFQRAPRLSDSLKPQTCEHLRHLKTKFQSYLFNVHFTE